MISLSVWQVKHAVGKDNLWEGQFLLKVVVLKLLIKSKAGQFLSKSFRLQDLSLFIFLNLSKATVGNFRVRERNNGLNLTSQHRPCIPDKCHVVINLFYNFEAMLQKHFHVTMNNPYLTFFAKLTQCWCHVLRSEKTFSI